MPNSYPSPTSSRSSSPTRYPNPLAASHLLRAESLLHKVETLQHILRSPKYHPPPSSPPSHPLTHPTAAPISLVELRHFHAAIKSEVSHLSFQAHTPPPPDTPPTTTSIPGSNLPFLESVWRVVQSEGPLVRGLRVGVGYKAPAAPGNGGRKGKMVKKRVEVDVVSDSGRRWIKVLGTSAEKLRREVAGQNHVEDMEEGEVEHPVVRTVRSLCRARRETWVGYLRPVVELRVVGVSEEEARTDAVLKAFFEAVRKEGAEVGFGPGGEREGEGWMEELHRECTRKTYHFGPPLPVDAPKPAAILDCTILLTLTSDISHLPHPPLPFERRRKPLHPQIRLQLKSEHSETSIFHDILLPLLSSRPLLVPATTRDKFFEILSMMGSAAEKARGRALFEDGMDWRRWIEEYCCGAGGRGEEVLKAGWEVRIPVGVVEQGVVEAKVTEEKDAAGTPSLESFLLKTLSTINRDVYIAALRLDGEVVSCNRGVVTLMEKRVRETFGGEEIERLSTLSLQEGAGEERRNEKIGPRVVAIDGARSLLGEIELGVEPAYRGDGKASWKDEEEMETEV